MMRDAHIVHRWPLNFNMSQIVIFNQALELQTHTNWKIIIINFLVTFKVESIIIEFD